MSATLVVSLLVAWLVLSVPLALLLAWVIRRGRRDREGQSDPSSRGQDSGTLPRAD